MIIDIGGGESYNTHTGQVGVSGDTTPMVWGQPLTDVQCEALQSLDAAEAGGDADWRLGAAYLYDLPDGATVPGDGIAPDVHIPPGTYLRAVHDKHQMAWTVHGDAAAYVDQIEQAWLAEGMADRQPCQECGADAGEDCRVPNCQGTWR